MISLNRIWIGWVTSTFWPGTRSRRVLRIMAPKLLLANWLAIHYAAIRAWLQHQIGIGHVGIHRIGGNLGGSDAGEDFLHLRVLLTDDCFALLLQFE